MNFLNWIKNFFYPNSIYTIPVDIIKPEVQEDFSESSLKFFPPIEVEEPTLWTKADLQKLKKSALINLALDTHMLVDRKDTKLVLIKKLLKHLSE